MNICIKVPEGHHLFDPLYTEINLVAVDSQHTQRKEEVNTTVNPTK